jgi:UDP-N-acetylmuramate--alanine ligase
MHIYFCGIGGAGIGPLAMIAYHAGYTVSGSNNIDNDYLKYLRKHGIDNIDIESGSELMATRHANIPIDWVVYSSALPKENPDHPLLRFANENNIKCTKRDEFIVDFLQKKNLKMIAVAGTHGKSTTTAMMIWTFKQLGLPVSYNVGAKLSFGEMGEYDPKSEYFVYECDEYDRNFLSYHPTLSLVTGVAWDHHDIYPTPENYDQAFLDFFAQSEQTILWKEDSDRLAYPASKMIVEDDPNVGLITLNGLVNRQNAWQVVTAANMLLGTDVSTLIEIINRFPGLSRRFELLAPNIYTDYAHTYEKIRGAIQGALEINPDVVIVYEGLHNRRQHFMLARGQYSDMFEGVSKIYWIPSYLAREDPNERLLSPAELITHLPNPSIAEQAELNDQLLSDIHIEADSGKLILCITAGGGKSLDEWLRTKL